MHLTSEVLALAQARWQHIQVDKPIFARKPKDALSFGIEALDRVFHGVLITLFAPYTCAVAILTVDNPDYPKADHMVYHDLVEALDGKIEALSIEDCHCKNDLELFEKFKKTTAIVGFVDISVSKIEVVDEVVERMKYVLQVLPQERLIAAPDCGLGFLGTHLSMEKLTVLCDAANQI